MEKADNRARLGGSNGTPNGARLAAWGARMAVITRSRPSTHTNGALQHQPQHPTATPQRTSLAARIEAVLDLFVPADQRHFAVRASDDPFIAICECSGAHREHLWSPGSALAQIAPLPQPSSPPRPRIIGTKLGKLVAMNEVSSTPTGLSLASPITRNAMAMR